MTDKHFSKFLYYKLGPGISKPKNGTQWGHSRRDQPFSPHSKMSLKKDNLTLYGVAGTWGEVENDIEA